MTHPKGSSARSRLPAESEQAGSPWSSSEIQSLPEKCDRICGKYAVFHKDRCPLYKANCAAMDAMNRKAK